MVWPVKSLHKNLHAKVKVQRGLFLDIVIAKCPPILKLLAIKEGPLLVLNMAFTLPIVSDGLSFTRVDLGLRLGYRSSLSNCSRPAAHCSHPIAPCRALYPTHVLGQL
jgi:hypothetical protein